MSLIQSLITSDKYGVKCPYEMKAVGLCIHNTYNDAPAQNEVTYMKRNNNEVSFHVAVDDKEAIQAIPFNRNAWHAGDGGSGQGNRKYIALEICYSKSGGSKFVEAEKRATKVAASILKQNGWGITELKKHQDFSGKYCPHRTLDMGWSRFVSMVQSELKSEAVSNPSNNIIIGTKVKVIGNTYATGQSIPGWVKNNEYTVQEVKDGKALLKEITSWVYTKDLTLVSGGASTTSSYKIKITADVLNVRSNPGTNYPVKTTVKNGEVYTIVETNNGWGKLKSGAGWISLEYTSKI